MLDGSIMDPSRIDLQLESRSISFENPSGARSSGGLSAGGRKGAPSRDVQPGEVVELANIIGPGTLRHIWMTIPSAPPEIQRALVLEIFYDDRSEPSASVPVLDFFGCPHGRLVEQVSVLHAVQEARGMNTYVPIPFGRRIRLIFTNASERMVTLYYQVDYTLEPGRQDPLSYLHVSFRRENPTEVKKDFTIAEGFIGPGRFLGSVIGIRTLGQSTWYGEGEMKIYFGDEEFPTICGTGIEDYVGTAWGMGPHYALYAGAPLVIPAPPEMMTATAKEIVTFSPDFVGFYRWHLADPIIFRQELRITIQQIGGAVFFEDEDEEFKAFSHSVEAAGDGWHAVEGELGTVKQGIYERSDDYSAAAFVYCTAVQPVPRVVVSHAIADIGRRSYEVTGPFEN